MNESMFLRSKLLSSFVGLLLCFSVDAQALSCRSMLATPSKSLFTDSALSSLEVFESNFPELPKVERDPTHSEVLEKVEEYKRFAESLRANAQNLDPFSKDLFEKFYEDMNQVIERFTKWYKSGTWSIATVVKSLNGLIGTNNKIKSLYFEAKVAFLLHLSGFENIRLGTDLDYLITFSGVEDDLVPLDRNFLYERGKTEFDILATKDGVSYLIEVKSFMPISNNRFFQNLTKARLQMDRRDQFLKILGLRSDWTTALVFQYEFDSTLMDRYIGGSADIYFGLEEFQDPLRFVEKVEESKD